MFEARRLHPIAAVSNVLKQAKELLFPFIIFVVVGSKGTTWDLFYLIASTVAVLVVFVTGILSWLRFTYRIEEGELRIEEGIFIRKKRYIPFERIQSLDFSEGILHRPFGLVKVRVETAGSSGEAEGVLTAIKKEEALFIQEFLQNVKMEDYEIALRDFAQEQNEHILYKISSKELLLLASTSGGVGVVISACIAFFFQFDDFIPYEKVFQGLETFITSGLLFISIIVFIGFFIAWAIAVMGTMLKYANFTLKIVNEDFIITRGLLEKRQITIPLNRIQAIRIQENLIRQPLKYASVYIESAGGATDNSEGSRVALFPIIKKNRIRAILEPFIDGYSLVDECISVPRKAFIRYLFRGWVIVVPLVIVLTLLWHWWGLMSLILLPISALWSYLMYKDAGWRVQDNQLTLAYRTTIKHTIYMRKNRIQTLNMRESYLQRKSGLSSIQATAKSGIGGTGGTVRDLKKEDVLAIYRWFSRR